MKDVPEDQCKSFLLRHRLGIMALAMEGEAHAIPLYFAYDGKTLYFHSRPGDKDLFLDHTNVACFVVVQVQGDDDWTSVQVKGKVERVESDAEAERALEVMEQNPFPPEFGVTAKGQPNRSSQGLHLWMMRPRQITGRSSRSAVRVKGPGEP